MLSSFDTLKWIGDVSCTFLVDSVIPMFTYMGDETYMYMADSVVPTVRYMGDESYTFVVESVVSMGMYAGDKAYTYVNESVAPVVGHMGSNTLSYVKEEYQFATIMSLLLVIISVLKTIYNSVRACMCVTSRERYVQTIRKNIVSVLNIFF